MSNVKRIFTTWNKEVFGKVEQDITHKQDQLQKVQNSIHTIDDVRKEKALREEPEILMNREEVKWAQKARSNWIMLRDRSTKCFQIVVKQKRAKN